MRARVAEPVESSEVVADVGSAYDVDFVVGAGLTGEDQETC